MAVCAALLAAAAAGWSLWLIRSLRGRLSASLEAAERERIRWAAEAAGLAAALKTLERRQAGLETQVRDLLPRPGAPESPSSIDRLGQALSLHREGVEPASIAARLELPRPEVDLLLKVQGLRLRGSR